MPGNHGISTITNERGGGGGTAINSHSFYAHRSTPGPVCSAYEQNLPQTHFLSPAHTHVSKAMLLDASNTFAFALPPESPVKTHVSKVMFLDANKTCLQITF
eukprot:1040059-Pelagomonas_calceolata.AAC.9